MEQVWTWVYLGVFALVCVRVLTLVPAGCTRGRGGAAASDWEAGKAGKQDATLTQETGAIGDCLHCYPINRP